IDSFASKAYQFWYAAGEKRAISQAYWNVIAEHLHYSGYWAVIDGQMRIPGLITVPTLHTISTASG
ncbi:MAG: hypothetical protein LCH37_13170, partial [Bacteroidetes bacterium]|nr:hypothetical protein [Bacteroidota bacterium]